MIKKEEENNKRNKQYVRTFIFSMKIGTPIEKLNVITKFLMILIMSVVAIHMFDIPVSQGGPDLVGLILLLAIVFILLVISRTAKYLVTSYLALALPVLLGTFLWWLFFDRNLPGPYIGFYAWPGYFPIGVSTLALLIVFFGLYYRTRSITLPSIGALIIWYILITPATLDRYPFTWFTISFAKVIVFDVPRWSLTIAASKALGIGLLIYTSYLFLLTTRDNEIAGALRQLKISFKASFYVALLFRNLSIVFMDFGNIRMAQWARGAEVKNKNIFSRLIDLAYISVPMMASMIRRATEMGVAVYARGFEEAKNPVDYKETKRFSYMDVIIIGILLAFLVYTIVLGHTIQGLL